MAGCEIISKNKNTSRKRAKPQRRKGNKALTLCALCPFASLRETVYFFTASSDPWDRTEQNEC